MNNPVKSNLMLRILLALIGLVVIWLGLNVGLGGITTLGWQGPTDFITITNTGAFHTQDSHVRFLGGVWFGVGLLLFSGAFALNRMQPILLAITGLVFMGGLARLSVLDIGILRDVTLAPSLAAELVGFPLLAYWITRTTAPDTSSTD